MFLDPMRKVKTFASGTACQVNFRETRSRLRNLKPPQPTPIPRVDNESVAAPATPEPILEVVDMPQPTAEVIQADIPPMRPEIVVAKGMPMKAVAATVAEYYEVDLGLMLGPSRMAHIAFPRQVTMYLMRTSFNKPWNEIGRRMNRDHTTALHGYRKIAKLIETDQKVKDDIDVLRLKLADLLTVGAA